MKKSPQGFTLVEMLVAISIMSFMLLTMAQITNLTEKAWRMEQNRIDNFTKARSMVDLITDDLQRAVFRGDLPIFGSGGPNTTPTSTGTGLRYFTGTTFTNAFYTRLPGLPDPANSQVRDVSLVSYVLNSVNQGSDKIVLQRSDLSVPWSSDQNLSFQGDITPLLQNSITRQVSPGVVGFRLAFRRADGTIIDQSQYTGYNATNPVVAIDVGLAVVAKQSLAMLSTQQISDIQAALASATIDHGIKATWDQKVLSTAFYDGYPKDLGNGLKTFERWVACPAF